MVLEEQNLVPPVQLGEQLEEQSAAGELLLHQAVAGFAKVVVESC